MKKLVSGGIGLSILSLFVAIYVQARTVDANSIANYSHNILNSSISGTILIDTDNDPAAAAKVETAAVETKTFADDKEFVKKTGLVTKTAKAGRGAFSATAYCLKGRTALGHGVRRGIIAADPRVLKLGSTVTITAGQWSGTYLVSDTGGNVKGRRVDIWVPSCSEARRFGRRSVQVY